MALINVLNIIMPIYSFYAHLLSLFLSSGVSISENPGMGVMGTSGSLFLFLQATMKKVKVDFKKVF